MLLTGLSVKVSDSEGILTLDFQNRNLTFYTAELRSHFQRKGNKSFLLFLFFILFICFSQYSRRRLSVRVAL